MKTIKAFAYDLFIGMVSMNIILLVLLGAVNLLLSFIMWNTSYLSSLWMGSCVFRAIEVIFLIISISFAHDEYLEAKGLDDLD